MVDLLEHFFEKFYLRSGIDKNKRLIFNEYKGPVSNPVKNWIYYYEIIKCKISLFYLIIIRF